MKKTLLIMLSFLVYTKTWANAPQNTVVISEIGWMGTQASPYDEWIELHNYGNHPIDLENWTLQSADKKINIPLSGTIAAPKSLTSSQRFFLLERTDETTTNIKANQIYTGGLNNIGTQLILKNSQNEIIDQTPTEVWVAGNNKEKQSMERLNFKKSGTEKNNWKTTKNTSQTLDAKNNPIKGTPKNPNSVTPASLFIPPAKDFTQEPFSAHITHVAPTTYHQQAEWFSIKIVSTGAVDISQWSISNEKSTKKLTDVISETQWKSTPPDNVSEKTINNVRYPSDRLILLPPVNPLTQKREALLYFKKSPIALYDQGGSIKLINHQTNKVIDQVVFPKAVKKTIQKQSFREFFWFQNQQRSSVLATPNWHTAQDIINTPHIAPTKEKDVTISISEIAPNRINEPDFIELFIEKAPKEGANLKYTEIKHNGSVVYFFADDYWVQNGDFLLFYFDGQRTKFVKKNVHIFSAANRKSISNSSGTIELNYFAYTSQKKLTDFACWFKDKLNKTETKRVKNLNQTSSCQKTSFRPQESLAKNKNKKLLNHPHGTPGKKNTLKNIKNFRPIAVINPQKNSTHSTNVTGEKSIDPNGNWDIQHSLWELTFHTDNTVQFVQKFNTLNPASIHTDLHKTLPRNTCSKSFYRYQLTLFDQIGLTNTSHLDIPTTWNGKQCVITNNTKAKNNIEIKQTTTTKTAQNLWNQSSFFADFETHGHKPNKIQPALPPKKRYDNKAIELQKTFGILPKDIKKNISLFFQ